MEVRAFLTKTRDQPVRSWENPSVFKFVVKAHKIRKTAPKAPPKKEQSATLFIETISANSFVFAKLSLRKPRIWSLKRRNLNSKND